MATGSQQLTVNGGTPPFTWNPTSLPTGVTLSPSGLLSWSNLAVGQYPVEYQVCNTAGCVLCQMTIRVEEGSGGPVLCPGSGRRICEINDGITITHSYRSSADQAAYASMNSSANSLILQAFAFWDTNIYIPGGFQQVAIGTGMIQYEVAPIDGPSGTLAFAYFPSTKCYENDACENCLKIRFDTGDSANFASNFRFLKTMVHEIGHTLNFRHCEDTNDVMYGTILMDNQIALTSCTQGAIDEHYPDCEESRAKGSAPADDGTDFCICQGD